MKKIFTLMLALFAMVAIQAQNLLSEDFENGIPTTWLNIDADNDSYAWMEGVAPGVSGHNGSNGCAYSCSYYNSTVLTPNNWLITPAVTLTGNATLSFWVAAQDASYAAEHYGVYISTTAGTTPADFTLLYEETLDANGGARVQGTWKQKTVDLSSYTGQTVRIAFRHFNCTDMFYIDLDDVVIFAQPTNPTIIAQPTSIDFGTISMGNTADATVDIVAYNLTAGVTATTTAPFSVSTDGTSFNTTATVAAAGGTLYVRYAPTTLGTDNSTVTLASTGATNVTVSLSGTAIDCSNNSIPYSTDFTSEGLNQCWEVINANEDDYTFEFNTTDGYASIRYNSNLAMDDWLISPAFALTGAQMGSFDYRAGSTSWFEKFQVFAFGANDTVALTPVVEAHSNTYETQYLDLSALNGNYKIAIHGVSDADQLRLYITNFNVFVGGVPADLTLSTEALDFGTISAGVTSNPQYVIMHTVNVNEAFTLTTAAPFEISLNGTSYATTQTIPANPALTTYDTIFVRFAPTTANTFTGNLFITSTSYSDTVALTGVAADCSGNINNFPFVYDFNTGNYPPICWGYNNADNFWRATVDAETGDYAMGVEGVDMLVTPEINSTSPMAVMFDYRTYLGDNLDDEATSFRVGYSSTNNNPSSFTWLPTVTVTAYPEGDALFFTYAGSVPANTKYVAIDFLTFGTYGFYEDVVYMDNFKLLTDSYLSVSPENIDFGSIIYGTSSSVKTASVVGTLLTSDIAVTAPANFEVSINGTSFAATATMPQAGGNLYVRYNPTAIGSHNGNITLTSGNTTKTIAVSGSAIDCSGARTLPFTEDFNNENIPACWLVNSTSEETWIINTDQEGNVAAYCNYAGEGIQQDEDLITPTLDLTGYNTVTLTFQFMASNTYVMNDDPEEQYTLYIYTSTNGGTSFSATPIFDLRNVEFENWDWTTATVDLTPLAGNSNVKLNFNYYGMYGGELWMDDINITGTVGVNEYDNVVRIYPNPVQNVLNINANSNIDRVEVYNMMGQMVGSYNVNESNTQINTSNYANGVYTVKISTENGMTTQKFTVAR